MLKFILNRLKPQAKEIILEEQARFRGKKSITEGVVKLKILFEKYLQQKYINRALTGCSMQS